MRLGIMIRVSKMVCSYCNKGIIVVKVFRRVKLIENFFLVSLR